MTLVDKGFRAYTGVLTPAALRFLVPTRYALLEALKTRKVIGLLVASAVFPLMAAVFIYLRHNMEALAILPVDLSQVVEGLAVDATFFFRLLQWQSVACFFLFLVSGATLISGDMRDNALPLYLSRPITRTEYVAGKAAMLAILGSAVTWVPLGILILLQTSLAGVGWLLDHVRIPLAILVGSWVLIAVLAMLCLTMSALLRAKAAAEGAFLSIFLLTPILAVVIEETLHTELGALLHVRELVFAVARGLFGLVPIHDIAAVPAAVTLAVLMGVCVAVLARRVKAYEVVR